VAVFDFFGGVPQSILYDDLWTPPAQGDIFGISGVECTIYPACCGTVRAPGLDGSPLLLAS